MCIRDRFNVYPAKVFMGDTGSLALGGFVAGAAYMTVSYTHLDVYKRQQQVRSTQTLSVDLSRQRLLIIKIFSTAVLMQVQEKRDLSAWKEKNILFRMEM